MVDTGRHLGKGLPTFRQYGNSFEPVCRGTGKAELERYVNTWSVSLLDVETCLHLVVLCCVLLQFSLVQKTVKLFFLNILSILNISELYKYVFREYYIYSTNVTRAKLHKIWFLQYLNPIIQTCPPVALFTNKLSRKATIEVPVYALVAFNFHS